MMNLEYFLDDVQEHFIIYCGTAWYTRVGGLYFPFVSPIQMMRIEHVKSKMEII